METSHKSQAAEKHDKCAPHQLWRRRGAPHISTGVSRLINLNMGVEKGACDIFCAQGLRSLVMVPGEKTS